MIKSIIVLGGGTAGWMTAAYLNKVLRDETGRKPVEITLIESADIGVIGVGEATIPTIKGFLRSIDVPEWEVLAQTDATLKSGIKFVDWLNLPLPSQAPSQYYHLFESPMMFEGHSVFTHWQNLADRGADMPSIDLMGTIQGHLCSEGKSPKSFNSAPYESPSPYAYHLDAIKFGQYLRMVAQKRGVHRIEDTVESVELTDDGSISALRTKSNGKLSADFFIDCSGFAAVLIEKALGAKFTDWSESLLCDRAVACPIQHTDEMRGLRPFTTSTAKEAGWVWEIDLFTRTGNGYVYSSRHSDATRAEEILRKHVGLPEDKSVRHLSMKIGHREEMWRKNCLAIGLAAGFLEPLESTGIYLVEVALSLFVDHISDGSVQPFMAARFNSKMNQIYAELRDFIQLHYIISERDDSKFWLDYRNNVKISDELAYKLDLWTFKLPSLTDLDGKLTLFGPSSYIYILAGMDRLPAAGNHLSSYISPESSARAMQEIERLRIAVTPSMPVHRDFIVKQRSVAGELV